jgi:hypothetical protein
MHCCCCGKLPALPTTHIRGDVAVFLFFECYQNHWQRKDKAEPFERTMSKKKLSGDDGQRHTPKGVKRVVQNE